jgi:hypothetical protein
MLRLSRAVHALAALAMAMQRLSNRVLRQVVRVNGAVGPKGLALTNLAHANGVIHHFMYHHPPEEVRAALMLARLEALPQHEGVDLAHANEHLEFPNPPAVGLLCVLKAYWPVALGVVHVDGIKVPPVDGMDCPLL